MSKNYMPEVARMLGVEIGEEFDIFNNEMEELVHGPYKIIDNAIVDYVGCKTKNLLYGLLTGEYTLQKRPWRPKDCEMYWFVTPDDSVDFCYFFKDKLNSIAMLNLGNCFPSKEVAEYNAPRMLEKFEEIKKKCRG